MNQDISSNMDEMDRARQLRIEAEILEQKVNIRMRIEQLQKISIDPYYNQFLVQLLKDLNSGKATPRQVSVELEKSYVKYQQRISQLQQPLQATVPIQETKPDAQKKKSVEFKIGAHVFSIIGAVFVLVAFIIFSFNFMSGLAQGICLYVAAIILILLSELFLHKKASAISSVITGIGFGGLYAANIANYFVLETINGIVAMIMTLLIAAVAIFIGRRKDSTIIRIISLIGCYACFLPIKGVATDLVGFMIVTMMLLIVNLVGAIFQNQRNRLAINITHLVMHCIFSLCFIGIAFQAQVLNEYIALYLISSFIFISILSLQQSRAGEKAMFPLCAVASALCIFSLFLVGNAGDRMTDFPELSLFVRLLSDILVAVVSIIMFVLWKKDDGRRWAFLYYAAFMALLSGSVSPYIPEVVISTLAVFVIVKVLESHKELIVLDCITLVWVALTGIVLADTDGWYGLLFLGALLISVFRLKRMHLFHEIVIMLSTVSIFLIFFDKYLVIWYPWLSGWQYPIIALLLLLIFLFFNHLPWLKMKPQRPFNITTLCIATVFYFMAYTCYDYLISTVMMVVGAIAILVTIRKRYGLGMPRKFLLLAGFLTYYSLTSHYKSPVIVSILLMIIALTCVGVGFKQKDKAERVCGLLMAIFVCIKLVFYDFREVEALFRIVVFLVVGIIALAISFIYILLEKNAERKGDEKETKQEHCTNGII